MTYRIFTHFKLTTFTWILSGLMVLATAVIFAGSVFIEKNIVVINKAWVLYQTDLSEKARLEGALRAAIGYGGMIHDFKNFVLRNDEKYKEDAESHLGAAVAILEQYKALELTTPEIVAIEDILSVFSAYKKAIHKSWDMIKEGNSIIEIDQAVKVNDEPAIRGLKVLRDEVVFRKNNNYQLSKSRILADLRAAMGYGGMIHKFKNLILRHNDLQHDEGQDISLVNEITAKIHSAKDSISQYRQLTLRGAEELALSDIESVLENYLNNINEIHQLMALHKSVMNIDDLVKVDDTLSLRGLMLLEHEINRQVSIYSNNVSNALEEVDQAIIFGKWGGLMTFFVVMLIAIVLIRFYVIQPIHNLTKNMVRLADNRLDTEISGILEKNEIGQMARAVMVFKKNMIKQQSSEQALIKANKKMKLRLAENKELRERSEEQTTKALLMSEYMAEAQRASEKALLRAEKDELFVSSILNAVRDAIITINIKGIIESFNPGAEEIFGYKAYEVIGKNISILMPEPYKSEHDSYLERFAEGKSHRDQSNSLEQLALRKNGETFPVEVTLNTVHIADEIKVTGVLRDITERKKWEEKINQLAMTDPLTGLANRNQYEQRLSEAVQLVKRNKIQFALLIIDLDKFKPVNDKYGHAVGDILLQKVAEILLESSREVDTVARLGGDEFAIIINAINEPQEVSIVAERILKKLSSPIVIENNKIQIGASMGISCCPADTVEIESLMRMADEVLYLSKQEGRHTYRYYSQIQK